MIVDRFGNVELLADAADLERAGLLAAATASSPRPASAATRRPWRRAFGDVAPKGMLVHVDSHGMVAVAVNGGSAAARLPAAPGDRVSLGRW